MPVFELDFTGDTTETVESGGRPPAGFHLCDLSDVFDNRENPDITHFDYVVVQSYVEGKLTDGFAGKKLSDKVEQPAGIEDDRNRATAISKIKVRAHRLGLWDGESAMRSIDFTAAIGVRVVVETALGKPGKPGSKYAGQQFVEVKFDGIYPLTHKRCPACWKQPETTAAPGATPPSERVPSTASGRAEPAPAVATPPAASSPSNLWEGI